MTAPVPPRVVPTLTEVLDEPSWLRPLEPRGAPGADAVEDMHISLDWGDEAAPALAAEPQPSADDVAAEVAPQTADGADSGIDASTLPQAAPAEEAGEAPQVEALEALEPPAPAPWDAQAELSEAEPVEPAEAAPVPLDELSAQTVPVEDWVDTEEPVDAAAAASNDAVEAARIEPALRLPVPPVQPVRDPGTQAVRQLPGAAPGLSAEQMDQLLARVLDQLLSEELPSALVEVLIRMSPEISASLHEALRPSLSRLVAEALARERP